ncbi:winged helix DNA-binding protein [Aureimonas sp. OT7]|uniref:MarR family transcriptional regulator n=1 Tax=Aureimonas altamirensis TaxID=370622 RepID=A0A0B1QBZ3_9HYPH|nr:MULTISPECIES: winged helix DNA-binding protein [Aureimonas]KHJ56442.1 MarR family transcriptional regulator [Aureimonas altamirensis]QOG05115.1 winged helix DNA-binding protein [Aureimonas sp. OT7]
MNNQRNAQAAAAQREGASEDDAPLKTLYLETLQLVERLHRRLLDVVKDEFDRAGRTDINAVQALLLFNIGDSILTAGELRSRGFYLGSNVSYNLKKLVELGFIDHQKSASDKRAVRISLTPEGLAIAETVAELYDRHIVSIDKVGGLGEQEFQKMNRSLQRLDRFWNDTIMYRL